MLGRRALPTRKSAGEALRKEWDLKRYLNKGNELETVERVEVDMKESRGDQAWGSKRPSWNRKNTLRDVKRGFVSRIRAEKAGMGRLSIFPCVKKI